MRAMVHGIVFFLAWSTASMVSLRLPLGGALLWALGLCAGFVWWYVVRARRHRRLSAVLRLRPLGPHLPWVLAAAPTLALFSAALSRLYARLPPVGPEPASPIQSHLGTAGGVLLMVLLAAVFAPLLEEFAFRGLLQHRLERRCGAAVGIVSSSLCFALLHGSLAWVPPLLLAGLTLGTAVAVTRSIWAGVLLHAAHNAASIAEPLLGPALRRALGASAADAPGGWAAWALVLSGSLLVYLGYGIHRTSRSGVRRTPFARRRRAGRRQAGRVRAGATPGIGTVAG